jgi:HEAT repeat protein
MKKCIFFLPAILVVSVGCKDTMSDLNTGARQLGGFGQRLVENLTGNTATAAAVKMESEYFPDERREGIANLSTRSYGRNEPYVTRYSQIAQLDEDYLVRAQAVRALNHSRADKFESIYLASLDDKNELVRLEACKALSNMPDEKAIPKLLKIVGDNAENRDVRIAAADALRHYGNIEVARALVNQLGEREFGVAWQSRESLKKLTGRDFDFDEAQWLNYLTTNEKPFA